MRQPDKKLRDLATKHICDEFQVNRAYVKRFLTQYLANHKYAKKKRKRKRRQAKKHDDTKSVKQPKAKKKKSRSLDALSDSSSSELSPWETGFTSLSELDSDEEDSRSEKKKKKKTTKKDHAALAAATKKKKKKLKSSSFPPLPDVLESRMKEYVRASTISLFSDF